MEIIGNQVRRFAVEEIQKILEYSQIFKKVSTGKNVPLTEEVNFPSCYIKIDGTTADLNGNIGGKAGCEYDLYMDVRLIINMELVDNLDYLDIESNVVAVILKDSQFWNVCLDRDYIGSGWDDDANHPKKSGELGFNIRLRSPV